MIKLKPTFGQTCTAALFAITDERRKANLPVTREALGPLFAEAIDKLDAERPKVGKAKRSKVEQSALFDALAAACGVDPREITNGMGATIGTALADISSVTPDLAAAEIDLRAARYRREHQGWSLTPQSLAKYWGELGGPVGERKQYSASAATNALSPQDFIPEPDGWRTTLANDRYVDEITLGMDWSAIRHATRKHILKRLEEALAETP